MQVTWGPRSLEQWLRFWQGTPYNTFDLGYLMNWGARWVLQQAAAADGSRHRLLRTMPTAGVRRAVLTAAAGQALQLGVVPQQPHATDASLAVVPALTD